MTQPTRVAYLLLLLLFVSNDTQAQCPSGVQESVVFFGNGIETSREKANDAKDLIQVEVESRLTSPRHKECTTFDIAYNRDEMGGSFLDYIQSFTQLFSSYSSRLVRMLSRLELTPAPLVRAFANIAIFFNKLNYVNDSDLRAQVEQYRHEIQDLRRKVIVVSHSQGNFYSNEAYAILATMLAISQREFAIVSVASPDSFVAGTTLYTTLFGDIVLVVPGRLEANTPINGTMCEPGAELTFAPSAFQCHGFIESYLVGTSSKAQILTQVINAIPVPPPPADLAIAKTDTPDPVSGGGHLTYTLTVQNVGGSPAGNVTVTDTLRADLTNVQCSISCTLNAETVTVSLGTLAAGAQVSFEISATAPTVTVPTGITNTAAVTTTSAESSTANNQATTTTTVNPLTSVPTFSLSDTFTLRFFDPDDIIVGYITNTAFSGQQVLTATFPFRDTGNVDISSFIRAGRNVIRLELTNTSPNAGWTYGYDFRVNSVTRDAGQCGVWNTFGCENNDFTQGLVWTHDIVFDVTASGVSNWSTYQHDSSRSGRSSVVGPVLATEAWSINLPNGSRSAAIAADGKLWHTVNLPGAVRSFQLQAFSQNGVMAVDTGPFAQDPGPVSFRPDRGLYVAARARIYSFTATGQLEWSVDTLDPGPSSPAVRPDGSFVVSIQSTSCQSEVVSFSRGGNRQWQVPFGCSLTAVALTPDGDVVVGDPGLFGFVHRLDGATGQIEWSRETSRSGPPSVSASGRIFFLEGTDPRSVDSPARLVAVNPDGSTVWQTEVLGVSLRSPVSIHGDGGVSVVTTDFNAGSMATLRRFLADGSPSWTRTLVPVTSGSPAVLIDGAGHVFVSLEQNTTADPPVALIQAFDHSGSPLWSHNAQFVSWTIIGIDGTLYAAIVDASGYRLIAFRD